MVACADHYYAYLDRMPCGARIFNRAYPFYLYIVLGYAHYHHRPYDGFHNPIFCISYGYIYMACGGAWVYRVVFSFSSPFHRFFVADRSARRRLFYFVCCFNRFIFYSSYAVRAYVPFFCAYQAASAQEKNKRFLLCVSRSFFFRF